VTRKKTVNLLGDDPLWYQKAIIYQLHVRSFFDGNGDGIGDFEGLTAKLDYLQDLGVTALWMLPFYPSPLRDGGYDIADYFDVNPEYGSMRDFRTLVEEAHARGLRVITEVVINHTSDQHPWFQRARRAPRDSPERNFYVWTDDPTRYSGARIIFQDFEASNWTWDPVAGQYFWHRFYHHQPDLNFANPAVHEAVFEIIDFWLATGVDGLRLDAIPYLYEAEGTNCENLPETHAYLKALRAHVDENFPNRMLLAEANMWPEDTRAYFGSGQGDECHMAFNFPVMPRMYMAVQMEDRYPLVDIMHQTPPIPPRAQWALFLRNHDELTLEMVTDEERDYMYRSYADDPRARINVGIRRRLAPLQKNDRNKIELLNGLLMSLPGTPIVYYGDEIGMGDNIYLGDRDGVRTPMQWSADRNSGFSTANPQQLFLPVIIDPEYRYESVNVANQQNNPSSLLVWMRKLIAQRKRYPVFGHGDLTMLQPDNPRILAFVRSDERQTVLVVANLSRFPQPAELDLSAHRGLIPVEVFGGSRFPMIDEHPYQFTMAPHAFLWLRLAAPTVDEGADVDLAPTILVPQEWTDVLSHRPSREAFETVLPAILAGRSWFNPKRRSVETVRIVDALPLRADGALVAEVAFIEVAYTEDEPETYQIPLSYRPTYRASDEHRSRATLAVVADTDGKPTGIILDAVHDPRFAQAVFDIIRRKRQLTSDGEQLVGLEGRVGRAVLSEEGLQSLEPNASRAPLRNSAILFGDRFFLKVFRRVDPGVNPEWEIGRFLTDETTYQNAAKTYGAVELRRGRRVPMTLAVLQELVLHERDGWEFVVDHFSSYQEELYRLLDAGRAADLAPAGQLAGFDDPPVPDLARELFGPFLTVASNTGERLAGLHVAMASGEDPGLRPESFPPHYQRQLYQAARSRLRQGLRSLRTAWPSLPGGMRDTADEILDSEAALLELLEPVKHLAARGLRMRTHGDLHLGQVLITGADVAFIDFEGRPTRFISQRREKRSPLRDLVGLTRSLDVASWVALAQHRERFNVRPGSPDAELLDRGTHFASSWLQVALVGGYRCMAEASLLTEGAGVNRVLTTAFLVEKLGIELEHHLAEDVGRTPATLAAMRRLLAEEREQVPAP
jgi:maltose alpha-D-glucosyltransferase/alpha-amylase